MCLNSVSCLPDAERAKEKQAGRGLREIVNRMKNIDYFASLMKLYGYMLACRSHGIGDEECDHELRKEYGADPEIVAQARVLFEDKDRDHLFNGRLGD